MRCSARLRLGPFLALLAFSLLASSARGVIRDGGVDPANLGQGGWLYLMHNATNHLSPNYISAVTNENSLFQYITNQGLRYVIVKSATGGTNFCTNYWDGSYSTTTPVFTSNLVNIAHANGLKIFGSSRSWGANIPDEIKAADYVFQQGADGFIFDAEAEWESGISHPWITNASAQAWWLCGTVRSNWPTKFIAHNPFDTLYLHSSFPYKEFGYWTDCVMPQAYHHAASQGSAVAAIHWTDVNYKQFQDTLSTMPPSTINGQKIYWTNAIKPLALMRDVYGTNFTTVYPAQDVMNFLDYMVADPNCVTAGGYQGSDYFRTELYDLGQWSYIKAATIGNFAGVVNSIILDDARATVVGAWTMVKTIDATTSTVIFSGATGTDINSFGTNYFAKGRGDGSAYLQFTPNILVPGDYNLYQWHPTRATASAAVPFVINYGAGSTTIYANQQTNPGNWSLLGRFNFGPGTSGNIRVTDGFPESGAIAMADGLKLVFVPPTALPSAPTRLKATTVSSSQITLAWTDTSTNAGCFAIARATNSGGPYQDVAAVAIRPTSYLDVNLTPSTTYYYVVRATNFLGASANSGQALATTLPFSPVLAWGDNSIGQGTVPFSATNIIAIAAGPWHTLALRADGAVLAWGNNFNGQCAVPPSLTNALAIAAGGYHSLAIRSNGAVEAWGDSSSLQTNVPSAALTKVMALSAGTLHSLALRTDGIVVAWGDNTWGQTNLPAGLNNVTAIAAGGNHCLALKTDGTVVAWGENTDAGGNFVGQAVVPAGLANVTALAAGEYHSLALRADGSVVAWGDNSEAQCSVPAGLSNVVALAGGGAHSLALKADGSVVAWGANWNGQCALPPLSDVVAVGAGEYHSLALVAGTLPVPLLYSPAWLGNRFSVLLQTMNRKHYTLECQGSLTANWSSLSTNAGNGALMQLCDPPIAPTNSSMSAPDSMPVSPARGFYRVRLW